MFQSRSFVFQSLSRFYSKPVCVSFPLLCVSIFPACVSISCICVSIPISLLLQTSLCFNPPALCFNLPCLCFNFVHLCFNLNPKQKKDRATNIAQSQILILYISKLTPSRSFSRTYRHTLYNFYALVFLTARLAPLSK